jgi:hypothetical protein
MSNRDGNGEGQSHWSLREYITSPRALFLVLGIAVAVALGYGIYTGNNTILVALSGFMLIGMLDKRLNMCYRLKHGHNLPNEPS